MPCIKIKLCKNCIRYRHLKGTAQHVIMGRATGGCEGDIVPHFWDPEGTMKMIFLGINLCFCKTLSLIDRQCILNIRNFLTRGTLV